MAGSRALMSGSSANKPSFGTVCLPRRGKTIKAEAPPACVGGALLCAAHTEVLAWPVAENSLLVPMTRSAPHS